jgi:hypothetical protein
MVRPAAIPLKFVRRRLIPFLKSAAAIPVALADSLALGPRICAYGQNKTN